jgi:hypothetical protein
MNPVSDLISVCPKIGECKMDVEIIVAIISSCVAIVTVVVGSIYRSQELKERRNEEQRREINDRMNNFYGPLTSYLNVVKALHSIFRSDKPKDFRTLTYLLNPDQEYDTENGKHKIQLNETDKNLLEEIIEIEKKIEELIIAKSGMIYDESLMFEYTPDPKITDVKPTGTSLIALAIAHFRLLRMAYNGNFIGETEKFKDFIYPREFDLQIRNEVKELKSQLEKLH